jgi:hypothetical protein
MAFGGAFQAGFVPALDRGGAVAGNGLLNNLIAYYKLDEAAGANDALDAHTGGLTMTQVHSPGSAAGIIGTARTGDGANDYFFRVDDANFSAGDVDFTMSAWVYLANIDVNSTIFSKYNTSGALREWLLFYNDNDHVPNHRFTFVVSNNGSATLFLDAATLGAPAINTWYHVVAWHDSVANVIGIAVNGGGADTLAHATGVFDSTARTCIGAIDNLTAYRCNGSLDEIGFWKSAAGGGGVLTAAQRTSLYNAGAGLAYAAFTL